MTAHSSTNSTEEIKDLLEELESCIADYPEDLREIYAQGKVDLPWQEDVFGDETSEVKGLSARNLALIHRLMFASAFTASVTSLPDRGIDTACIASTTILDAVTEAGLPPRDFLHHYGKYGNQFTWKLMKLTGRISENSSQPSPDLVKGV